MERDPEAWGGGQSLRPSEADGERAREVTLHRRGRVNDKKGSEVSRRGDREAREEPGGIHARVEGDRERGQ